MPREKTPSGLTSQAFRSLDDPAELHELGADLEPGAPHGRHVDVEADLLILHAECDLPAAGGKVIDFADRQDRRAVETLENGGEAVPFRSADEQDVALAGFFDIADPLDDQPSAADGLAAESVVENGAEGIFPENADDQGVAAARECVGRPVDVRREVVEVGGLDLIFGEAAGARLVSQRAAAPGDQSRGQAEEHGPAAHAGARYHRRTILP